jgi:hypothetical protein
MNECDDFECIRREKAPEIVSPLNYIPLNKEQLLHWIEFHWIGNTFFKLGYARNKEFPFLAFQSYFIIVKWMAEMEEVVYDF